MEHRMVLSNDEAKRRGCGGGNPSPEEIILLVSEELAKEGWELISVVPSSFVIFGLTAFYIRR